MTRTEQNIVTTENADLLRDRCEALEYLLEQTNDSLRDCGHHYVEASAFLNGDMTVADVLQLKELDA